MVLDYLISSYSGQIRLHLPKKNPALRHAERMSSATALLFAKSGDKALVKSLSIRSAGHARVWRTGLDAHDWDLGEVGRA